MHESNPDGISVIIPALNEALELAATVRRARRVPEVREVIVVDGGSEDGTVDAAEDLGCRVFEGPRGRGHQIRFGVERATEPVLMFLHADTWLQDHAGDAALRCLGRPDVVAGGFWKVFREPVPLLRGSRFKCWIRLRVFGRIAADQGIFIRQDRLAEVGGFPEVVLMEEFDLCRRLRRVGKLALADATVTTSARRFIERGVLGTYARMWLVTALYQFGVGPDRLRRIYG